MDFPVPAERFQEKCVDRSSLKSFCHAGFKKRTTELWDSTLPSEFVVVMCVVSETVCLAVKV